MSSQAKVSRLTTSSCESSSEQSENEQTYRLKRERNNEAVKKSREKSRQKKEEVGVKMDALKKENCQLEGQIGELSGELSALKKHLLMTVSGKRRLPSAEQEDVSTTQHSTTQHTFKNSSVLNKCSSLTRPEEAIESAGNTHTTEVREDKLQALPQHSSLDKVVYTLQPNSLKLTPNNKNTNFYLINKTSNLFNNIDLDKNKNKQQFNNNNQFSNNNNQFSNNNNQFSNNIQRNQTFQATVNLSTTSKTPQITNNNIKSSPAYNVLCNNNNTTRDNNNINNTTRNNNNTNNTTRDNGNNMDDKKSRVASEAAATMKLYSNASNVHAPMLCDRSKPELASQLHLTKNHPLNSNQRNVIVINTSNNNLINNNDNPYNTNNSDSLIANSIIAKLLSQRK